MLSLQLSRAVGLLQLCLTAVSTLRAGGKDEHSVRRAIKPKKVELQQVLTDRLLAETEETLPTARREVQLVQEHLSDAIDFSRSGKTTGCEESLARAAALIAQLIEEITEGKPKEARIEPVRVRTQRPFGQGFKGAAPPLKRTERGVPNPTRRPRSETQSHFVASACY